MKSLQFVDTAGLVNVYVVLTATVLILMILIILVIGRIVLMKRHSSANNKLHDCAGEAISTKDCNDVISLDSDLNSADHAATISNMPRDEV